MLQHVYERASQSRYLTCTIIATDDPAVFNVARKFGARVVMTRPDHLSGTDRVAEVASSETAEVIVNIQGDEPLIDPAAIDTAILPLVHEPEVQMATLKKRIENPREIDDPNVVKVVTDAAGDAIYFSRCPIPYLRPDPGGPTGAPYFKHIGLYVYRRSFLLGYSSLPVGPLERAERLEPEPVCNCGPSKTGSGSAWWRRIMSRLGWTRRRIWKGSPGWWKHYLWKG